MTQNRDKLLTSVLNQTPLILFALIFIVFGLLSSKFFEYRNLENIIKQASYIGIVAVGMTFVLLTAGIDLSVGSNMYLSAVVAGMLIRDLNAPVSVAFLCCLLTGLLFGCVNAFAVTKLKIIPFVATLGTMVAGRGVALMLTKSHQVPFPRSVTAIGSARLFGQVSDDSILRFINLPMPTIIFAAVVLLAFIFLRRTMWGRQIYAVGNSIDSARKAGINTGRILAGSYIICGLLAALGGFISVAQLGNINSGFGEGEEFNAIAAAVLGGASLFGGIGSVFPGTVLGAVTIRTVWAGLVVTQVDLYLQPIVAAAIIFLAVLIDSFRNLQIRKLSRRHIRIEDADN